MKRKSAFIPFLLVYISSGILLVVLAISGVLLLFSGIYPFKSLINVPPVLQIIIHIFLYMLMFVFGISLIFRTWRSFKKRFACYDISLQSFKDVAFQLEISPEILCVAVFPDGTSCTGKLRKNGDSICFRMNLYGTRITLREDSLGKVLFKRK